ncbi:MAG TPA: hypothetical protein VHB46_08395 [Burkholderiales bacterium]|nr:hypothetical protein [Burkholderiales bacterium]
MPIDLLARPIVDALLKAFDQARDARLRSDARKALGEAISELIRLDPDVTKAEARIAVARAAGILDKDLFTAESMLKKVKKAGKGREKQRSAKKPAAKQRKRRAAAAPKRRQP